MIDIVPVAVLMSRRGMSNIDPVVCDTEVLQRPMGLLVRKILAINDRKRCSMP